MLKTDTYVKFLNKLYTDEKQKTRFQQVIENVY